MYKDTDWTKIKGMNGTHFDKYGSKDVTRPKTDGNFTCAVTWPGKGNDQQLGSCNANGRFDAYKCKFFILCFKQLTVLVGPHVWADTDELNAFGNALFEVFQMGSIMVKPGCKFLVCTEINLGGDWSVIKIKLNILK